MNRLINWLKSFRLDRILTVFFAGLLLFVTTACSGAVSAKTPGVSPKTADQVRPEVPKNAVTNPYQGGMNEYSDVDPRRDTSAAEAKAKGLLDNSQSNLQKRADSPEQYGENYRTGTPLGERTRRLGEDVGQAAKNVTEDVAGGAQKGLQNIKENAQDAPRYLKRTGKETVDADQVRANDNLD